MVCPQFLRTRECGQVDVAVLLKRRSEHYLKVVEAKSKIASGPRQMRRLLASVDFLAKILNVPAGLEQFCSEDYLPKPRRVLKLEE